MSEAARDGAVPPAKADDVKRIAVVAVHGVGDHPPFLTAREIGDLLANLEYKPDNSPRYAPFTEVTKRINVRPVKLADRKRGFDWTDEALQRNTWGPMDALARAVYRGWSNATARISGVDNAPDSLDHLFLKGQLIEYKGEAPEDTYQCLRLEGKRVAPAPAKGGRTPSPPTPDTAGIMTSGLRAHGLALPSEPAESATAGSQADQDSAAPGNQEKIVHIYEMYWSDLSQLGSGITRILGELYQLLFHLGSVSVNNVLAGAIQFHGTPAGERWRRFSQAQWFAAAMLAWPIPLLSLLMAAAVPLIVIVSLIRSHLSNQGEFLVLDVLVTLLAIGGAGLALKSLAKVRMRAYRLPLPLLTLAGIAVG